MSTSRPEQAVARVLDAERRPVGLAFVVAGRYWAGTLLLTCAHVVNAALRRGRTDGSPVTGELSLQFPFGATPLTGTARVVSWLPVPGDFGRTDVAALATIEPLAAAVPGLDLLDAADRSDLPVRVWAARPEHPNGRQLADGGQLAGVVHAQLATGPSRISRDAGGPLRVGPGNCGGPVWRPATGEVVGMLVTAAPDAQEPASQEADGYLLGARALAPALWHARTYALCERWLAAGRPDALLLTPVQLAEAERIAAGYPALVATFADYQAASRRAYPLRISPRAVPARTRVAALRLPHAGEVRQVRFSESGDRLLTGTSAGAVAVWRAGTGERLGTFQHAGPVAALAPDPTGALAVSCGEDESRAVLWHAGTGTPVAGYPHGRPVSTVEFSPDGRCVLSAGHDGTVAVWRPDPAPGGSSATLAYPLLKHTEPVRAAVFSADGRRVLTGCDDGASRLWDLPTGAELTRQVLAHEVRAVALHPDGALALAGYTDGRVLLWSPEGDALPVVRECGAAIGAVAFSPDGQLALATSGADLWVWGVEGGAQLARCAHGGLVTGLAVSPTGAFVVTASRDGSARLWDPVTGVELGRYAHLGRCLTVAVSPDGGWMASGGTDGQALLWPTR